MKLPKLAEREADTLSTRRRKIGKSRRREFDEYHGKPKGTRRQHAAGKGDATRDFDKELYDAGYEASFGATPEIRAAAAERWEQLRRERSGR